MSYPMHPTQTITVEVSKVIAAAAALVDVAVNHIDMNRYDEALSALEIARGFYQEIGQEDSLWTAEGFLVLARRRAAKAA